jgi:serine/threonine protein phosphatase PrpC
MEDDFFISKDGRFAGVYDGHGGAAVSKYLKQNLQAQVGGCVGWFCGKPTRPPIMMRMRAPTRPCVHAMLYARTAASYTSHPTLQPTTYTPTPLSALQFLAALPDEDKAQVGEEQVVQALSQAFQAVDDAVIKVRDRRPLRSARECVIF